VTIASSAYLKYPKTVVEFNFSSEAKPPDSITGFKD
jgi:hypothetical protein